MQAIRKKLRATQLLLALTAIGLVGGIYTLGNSFAADIAEWNVMCSIDHYGADDPIVYPNQPGASHMHSFYGNKSTNAATTTDSLTAHTPSSCGRNMGASDLSAYWVPSLYRKNNDGTTTQVKDSNQFIVVYYRRVGGSTGPTVKPFPSGLRMVAGDPHATSAQSKSVVYWDCGDGGPQYANIPTCVGSYAGQPIRAEIEFPNCWDGSSLDSADHRSHMAYAATTGVCPAGHPVVLPKISLEVWYPGITGGSEYFLSSGGTYSMHGDFFAAWDNRVQNALVASCLNAANECADINRNGNQLFRVAAPSITINLNDFSSASPYDSGSLHLPPPSPAPPPEMQYPTAPKASTPAPAATPSHRATATTDAAHNAVSDQSDVHASDAPTEARAAVGQQQVAVDNSTSVHEPTTSNFSKRQRVIGGLLLGTAVAGAVLIAVRKRKHIR